MRSLADELELFTASTLPRPTTPVVDTSATDARVTATLTAPLACGESALAGFQRKERELSAIFGALSLAESRVFHRRLANPQSADPVALIFGRLTIDRRSRMLALLADAPRRAMLARRPQ